MGKTNFDSAIYNEGVYGEVSIYDAWLRNANERDLLKTFLQENLNLWAPKSPLSIVDIGCGSGAAGVRLMDILEKVKLDYTYTGVEPYKEQLEMFQKKIGKNTRANFIEAGLENFESEQKYDIAFVVHSLYYAPNLREAIRRIHAFSKTMVVVHHGPRGINEVHQAFREYVKEGPHIISTYNDVAAALREERIDFQLETFPSEVNVQSIKEVGNETGKKLIQFFLERSDLSEKIIEDVRNFFRDRPDKMIHDVGIFVTKSA